MDIPESSNFVQDIIVNDLSTGKRKSVHTRFPPEPNGYIHIGHAKSICLNFGTANKYKDFGGIRIEDDVLITKDGCRFLGEKRIPCALTTRTPPRKTWNTWTPSVKT